ncbi:hypothetical protein HY230_08480 [Candidatus Acetothermia bacterium]|nr:hypothetical protein [Candidatus Acetothermia bacterium]
MLHSTFRHRLASSVFLLGCLALFLVLGVVPVLAGDHSGSVVNLHIYLQARCHENGFRLIPAQVAIITPTQTDSAKATPFVKSLPKGMTDIRLDAEPSFTFPGGPIGARHCDFNHWRVRSAGITRIVNENPLMIDDLKNFVYATAVYYDCTNPTSFPECTRPGLAETTLTPKLSPDLRIQLTPDGRLLGQTQLANAQRMRVQLFNLQGRLLLNTTGEGTRLEESVETTGRSLAAGVYVYAVTVWDADGRILAQRLGKVFVQH